ncbi:hypothetical protein FQ775_18670 [Nitratireductor mangrovi]|uniref:Lipoprotein n=1 Tax=Nitratireductor mangrovi TaxID=2599600 RepID=A0A5B8L324_9HYPH|nr:lipoprotein [Nitratireductor mangrovi]QDZ02243.1 hypothetical protein FQ775_18670 [Nitratireductor mangrovi]
MFLRRSVLLFVLLATATAIAACGRRGPPLSPYEAAVEARKEAEDKGEPLPPEPEKPVADKPFILDGLIE